SVSTDLMTPSTVKLTERMPASSEASADRWTTVPAICEEPGGGDVMLTVGGGLTRKIQEKSEPMALPFRSLTVPLPTAREVPRPNGLGNVSSALLISSRYENVPVVTRTSSASPGTSLGPAAKSRNVFGPMVAGSMGSLNETETAATRALLEPGSGRAETGCGGVAFSVKTTATSSVHVRFPPVSVAQALSPTLGCTEMRGVTKRCSNGKLPSVRTLTPST